MSMLYECITLPCESWRASDGGHTSSCLEMSQKHLQMRREGKYAGSAGMPGYRVSKRDISVTWIYFVLTLLGPPTPSPAPLRSITIFCGHQGGTRKHSTCDRTLCSPGSTERERHCLISMLYECITLACESRRASALLRGHTSSCLQL